MKFKIVLFPPHDEDSYNLPRYLLDNGAWGGPFSKHKLFLMRPR